MNEPAPQTEMEIDCASVKKKMDAGENFHFIDCREQNEYDLVKIEQARLVPMSTLQENISDLEPHKNDEIIVHCHHGGRSLQVTMWLRQQGFSNVKSMAGGIDHWAIEIDPSLQRY